MCYANKTEGFVNNLTNSEYVQSMSGPGIILMWNVLHLKIENHSLLILVMFKIIVTNPNNARLFN